MPQSNSILFSVDIYFKKLQLKYNYIQRGQNISYTMFKLIKKTVFYIIMKRIFVRKLNEAVIFQEEKSDNFLYIQERIKKCQLFLHQKKNKHRR
ncbi:unnamed protein product [Paramecium sonneborni]|uniref:Uncharacterized protein n=1 Tax=Paramecium sonneborni TaxID=65129 RepID=A0A8S1P574_9CILI|nr:unnamed protein product [Paramecium sonneborni]